MRCEKCNSVIKDNRNICPICGHQHTEELSGLNLSNFKKIEHEHEALPNGYPRHYYHEDGKRGFRAILSLYTRTFDFSGVSDWVEYWTQSLFLMVFAIINIVTRHMITSVNNNSPLPMNPSMTTLFLFLVSAAVIILSALPVIASTIRRLHDAGYSGFWYLLNFIPFFGSLIVLFMTLGPYKRNEFNQSSEKKPTIQVKYQD